MDLFVEKDVGFIILLLRLGLAGFSRVRINGRIRVMFSFWATICKTVRPICYRSVVCLSCLSVCLYCGQTVGRIKMKLGMQVGLGPGHIVLDGDPAPLPQRGTAPQF